MAGATADVRTHLLRHYAMSAGVLPFAVAPNGQVFFLIGRERERVGRHIYKRHVWCDFGGGISPRTHSLIGACREFAEETIGIVVGNGTNSATIDFVSKHVCENQPIRSMFGSSVPYDMYLIEIAYEEDLPKRFLERRQLAERIDACKELAGVMPQRYFHKSGRMRDAFLEKDMLSWITWEELQTACTSSWKDSSLLTPIRLRREFSATISCHLHAIASAVSKGTAKKK